MYRLNYVSDSNFLKLLNGLFESIKNDIIEKESKPLKVCGMGNNNENSIKQLKFMNEEIYLHNGRLYERCKDNYNIIERRILYKLFGWINKEQN